MDEVKIADILKRWAKTDEDFCEDLLRRCLDVLDEGDCAELEDSELDMLAAAGDIYASSEPPTFN